MTKVLFISRAYGENAGGMERLSYELIQLFPSAHKVVNETKGGRSLFATRVHSVVFALTVIPRAIFSSRNADVVHIGDPVLLLVAAAVRMFSRKPIVCTVHGLDVVYSNVIYQLYIRMFLSSCDSYIAISDFAKEKLEEHGISSEKITVIPPGISDHLYDSSIGRDQLAHMLGRDISGLVVLATTGRLITRKGHAWFVSNVLPHLPKNVIYVIAGNGPDAANLSQVIETLRLTDRVMLLGRISDVDQKILLNTIDAFIQPNIHVAHDVEGFGIAPLEAALCARPVFAARVDGIPSAIHDGKNGTLLPSEDANSWIDAITVFANHPTVNLEAREYTKKTFNWDVMKGLYVSILSDR